MHTFPCFALALTSSSTRYCIILHRFTVISGTAANSQNCWDDVVIVGFSDPERAKRLIDFLREIEADMEEFEALEWIITVAADRVRERRIKGKTDLKVVEKEHGVKP